VSDGIQFDFSDLTRLAADLGDAPKKSGPNILKAVEVTARHVKDEWRDSLKGARKLPRAAAAISYDIEADGKTVTAEIGPVNKGQGSLVGKTEFGSPGLAPRGYGQKALRSNEKDFQNGLEKAIGDVL
jgi:hypothetical protein